MRWKKIGHIFSAAEENVLMHHGARAPVPLFVGNGVFRIFFGAMDKTGVSRIFSLDIDMKNPLNYFNLITSPIVDIGEFGCFDDNGISPSDIINVDGSIRLYTIGFSIKNKLLFDAAVGMATTQHFDGEFEKYKGPILDRSLYDPCFATSPTVLYHQNKWHMWYVSGEKWNKMNGDLVHFYNIKYRTSDDGIFWGSEAHTCINYASEYEYAIARPSVIFVNGTYRMWYCFRSQIEVDTFRIGYAESFDGLNWKRLDNLVGIDVSNEGWDSEMICYPRVFEYQNTIYMLYNGNGYGKSGFGLAVLEEIL